MKLKSVACWPQVTKAISSGAACFRDWAGVEVTTQPLPHMAARQPPEHPIDQTLQSRVPLVHATQHKSRVFSTRSITVTVRMRNRRGGRRLGAPTNPRTELSLSLRDKDSLCYGWKFILESKITGHSRKAPADKLFHDIFLILLSVLPAIFWHYW